MIGRRSFLGAILAAATAPAFVRSGSLMVPRSVIGGPILPEAAIALPAQDFLAVYTQAFFPPLLLVSGDCLHIQTPDGKQVVRYSHQAERIASVDIAHDGSITYNLVPT